MRKTAAALLVLFGIVLSSAMTADIEACVGKTLYLGQMPGVEQEILAEIFTWLVSERTGTTIEIKSFPDSRASHSALEKASIDIYLEEPLVAVREILGHEVPSGEGAEIRQVVRKEYEEKYNLIWLEPWGVEGELGKKESLSSKIAPVVRKDTLVKFPALSRLVNKMAGVVDDSAMRQLLAQSSTAPVREVTKKFLKQKKLI